MSKIKLIMLVLVFGILSFYWFQYRPTQIRRDCSWIKKHANAFKGTTVEEAETDRKKCLKTAESSFAKTLCNAVAIPQPPRAEQDWYEPASEKDYNQCLHSNGL